MKDLRDIIAALEALPDYDPDAVCDIVRGIGIEAFIELDERPGQFGNYEGWHWKMRRARNNCPGFFKAINWQDS